MSSNFAFIQNSRISPCVPLVYKFQSENCYRNKKQQQKNQRVCSRLKRTPDNQSPGRATKILQHQPAQTPERDAGPKDEGHHIGMPYGIVKISGYLGAYNPGDQPEHRNTQSERLNTSDISWRVVIRLHYLCCPPEAAAAFSASSSFFLSSSFISTSGIWLLCRTLM